ncbi:MAG: VC0807 family protein [Verrucomicrobiota bacterium]
MAEADQTEAPHSGKPQDNPLLNVLLNVVVPAVILSYLSKEEGRFALGPQWALIIAVMIPVGYGIYHFYQFRQANLFSILGLVSVLLTGGLGLLKTSAIWFATKEALIPFILGLAILLSHYVMKKPLVRAFLLSPDIFDVKRIENQVRQKGQEAGFEKLIKSGTWMMAGSMFLSTVMNFFLNMWLLRGKEGGSTEYMEAIGKSTWMGFLVIGLPITVILIFSMFRIIKGIENLTGLDRDEIMLPR